MVASRGLIPSLVSHPKCPRILSLATPSLTKFCSSKPKGTLNLLAVHSALFPFVFFSFLVKISVKEKLFRVIPALGYSERGIRVSLMIGQW